MVSRFLWSLEQSLRSPPTPTSTPTSTSNSHFPLHGQQHHIQGCPECKLNKTFTLMHFWLLLLFFFFFLFFLRTLLLDIKLHLLQKSWHKGGKIGKKKAEKNGGLCTWNIQIMAARKRQHRKLWPDASGNWLVLLFISSPWLLQRYVVKNFCETCFRGCQQKSHSSFHIQTTAGTERNATCVPLDSKRY